MVDTVNTGNVIVAHYKGTFEDGTEFDNSYSREKPIEFTVGSGQMISGFDNGVIGMTIGEKKNINLAAEDAYGVRVDEAIRSFPKDNFPPDFEFQVDSFVQAQTEEGNQIMAQIKEVNEGDVVLDFNHPMAGKNLNFEIELIKIKS